MCMHACMHACDTCMHAKSKGLREEGRRMWRVAGSGAPTVGLPRRRCRRNGLVDGGWPRQAGAHGLLRLVFVGQETVGLCVYPLYVHM